MNPLNESWNVLKAAPHWPNKRKRDDNWSQMGDDLRNANFPKPYMPQAEEPEAPPAPAPTPPSPVGPEEEKYLQASHEKHLEASKPEIRAHHITWADPNKTTGWINGKMNIFADQWAKNNEGNYTESISEGH